MIAVKLENVSVRFFVFSERYSTLKEYLVNFMKGKLRYRELWALQDVSLEIKKGEYVGIIGRNGAGKTTLLKVISRIVRPYRGSVHVNGRVSPLIELGAGFDPELTGRENIYLHGAIMGFTKREMDRRVQQIIDFAELGEFIDMPVKNYSTGMFMRLAFSAAIDADPDILLVDEVLAVGDAGFQKKCTARLEELKKKGITLILVSHSMEDVKRLCTRVIWIERGRIQMDGVPEEVIPAYLETFSQKR